MKETYTPVEAQVALAIPNHLVPLAVVDSDTIAGNASLPKAVAMEALKSLSVRNMLFQGKTPEGKAGYALLQVGYGMPQAFFWGGQEDDHAKHMAKLVRSVSINCPKLRIPCLNLLLDFMENQRS